MVANLSIFNNIKQLISQKPEKFDYAFDNVLGTVLDLVVVATKKDAELAREQALSEIDRLEKVYNRFDKSSELNRYLDLDIGDYEVSADLFWLFLAAEYWQDISLGAFNPAVDELSLLWSGAQKKNKLPSQDEILERLEPFQSPSFELDLGQNKLRKLSKVKLNFNAIAKGHIVERACHAAFDSAKVEQLVVNIGGDIRHMSRDNDQAMIVGVSNPFKAADNQEPEIHLKISNQAIATSGSVERGYKIAGKWYSHVIDPRTGWPIENMLSTTVIAPDCATADVLATAFNVLEPEQSIEIANKLNNVSCYIVTKSGQRFSNECLKAHIVPIERINNGNK